MKRSFGTHSTQLLITGVFPTTGNFSSSLFFPLGEFSSCKLNQMQPPSKLSLAGDRSEISFTNINSKLVIILLLARTSRLLSVDIHYEKWIVMQIIFVGYFYRNLVAISLFTQVKKNITEMKQTFQQTLHSNFKAFSIVQHEIHIIWRKQNIF